jgi:hypothetical protein
VADISTMEVPTVEGIPNAIVGSGTIIKERNSVVGRTNTFLVNPCEIVNSIVAYDNQNDYRLYPNPASSRVSIKQFGETSNRNKRVVIYELVGKVALTDVLTGGNNEIDVSSLAAGPYYLTVQVGNSIISKMFIKL